MTILCPPTNQPLQYIIYFFKLILGTYVGMEFQEYICCGKCWLHLIQSEMLHKIIGKEDTVSWIWKGRYYMFKKSFGIKWKKIEKEKDVTKLPSQQVERVKWLLNILLNTSLSPIE